MKKTVYFECEAGISGDMSVAALLDLGADPDVLNHVLASLPLEGWQTEIRRVSKNGIDCCDFNVILEHDNHDHDIEYLYGDHWDAHHHEDPAQEAHVLGGVDPVHACHAPGDPEHTHESHDSGESDHAHESHNSGKLDHVHACHAPGHVHEFHDSEESDHAHESHVPEDPDYGNSVDMDAMGEEPHAHEIHRDTEGHTHSHTHVHGDHTHRHLADIYRIIDAGEMTDGARKLAKKIFLVIGEAESKAHAVPVEDVAFHEVGGVDSIIDIVSFAVCYDNLGVTDVIITKLCEGTGTVRCQHGLLPVPVPAVTNILAMTDLPVEFMKYRGEFITPTGAAIAAAIVTGYELPKKMRIRKIGLGAGKRNHEKAGILRAMWIDADAAEPEEIPGIPSGSKASAISSASAEQNAAAADIRAHHPANFAAGCAEGASSGAYDQSNPAEPWGAAESVEGGSPGNNRTAGIDNEEVLPRRTTDQVWKLETNIDDATGENLGYVMDRLLEAGARDVSYIPCYMKKNRPAWELHVICDDAHRDTLEDLIFRETTTIGIRRIPVERVILNRSIRIVTTAYGKARVKVSQGAFGSKNIPEYDDVVRLCRETSLPYGEIYRAVRNAAKESENQDE